MTDELTVIAGNNYVNKNAEVLGHVTASGIRNTYAVDVSDLGGMYANHINLISTESGVGVNISPPIFSSTPLVVMLVEPTD